MVMQRLRARVSKEAAGTHGAVCVSPHWVCGSLPKPRGGCRRGSPPARGGAGSSSCSSPQAGHVPGACRDGNGDSAAAQSSPMVVLEPVRGQRVPPASPRFAPQRNSRPSREGLNRCRALKVPSHAPRCCSEAQPPPAAWSRRQPHCSAPRAGEGRSRGKEKHRLFPRDVPLISYREKLFPSSTAAAPHRDQAADGPARSADSIRSG